MPHLTPRQFLPAMKLALVLSLSAQGTEASYSLPDSSFIQVQQPDGELYSRTSYDDNYEPVDPSEQPEGAPTFGSESSPQQNFWQAEIVDDPWFGQTSPSTAPLMPQCARTAVHFGVLPDEVLFEEVVVADSCQCCHRCAATPQCASFSVSTNPVSFRIGGDENREVEKIEEGEGSGGMRCRLYDSRGSYYTIQRSNDSFYIMQSLFAATVEDEAERRGSHSGEFCTTHTDCVDNGDRCYGLQCGQKPTLTCLDLWKQHGVTNTTLMGAVDGRPLLLHCAGFGNDESQQGYTLVLTSTGAGWTRDIVLARDVTSPSLQQPYSILRHVDQMRAERYREGEESFDFRVTSFCRVSLGGGDNGGPLDVLIGGFLGGLADAQNAYPSDENTQKTVSAGHFTVGGWWKAHMSQSLLMSSPDSSHVSVQELFPSTAAIQLLPQESLPSWRRDPYTVPWLGPVEDERALLNLGMSTDSVAEGDLIVTPDGASTSLGCPGETSPIWYYVRV